jgi:RNA polymerase sigma-70 factor (sigma-E family)
MTTWAELGRGGAVESGVAVETSWDPVLVDLYESQRLPLLRLAVLLTDDREAAEDVVQEAFLGLHRRWRAVDPAAAPGYLRTSVVNRSRSLHRRRGVAARYLWLSRPGEAPSADLAVLLGEEHRLVVEAIRRLPRRQREVLVLRYWSDLSEAEIAAALGVSRGTVKSSASRALSALEKQLGGRHER